MSKQQSHVRITLPPVSAAPEDVVDARRYRRLRVLGAAPCDTKQLDQGTVLRFTNLDDFVDADIRLHPSRGEAGTDMSDSMRPSRRDEPDETELRGLAEDLVCHWDAMPGVTEATHRAITGAIHTLAKWLDGETDGNQASTEVSVATVGALRKNTDSQIGRVVPRAPQDQHEENDQELSRATLQPQLRAGESDPRGGDRVSSLLSAIVPICGNCRFLRPDEHAGGRNICEVIGEEKSERYKYATNHTCDAENDYGERGFQADYWHLEGVLRQLGYRVEPQPGSRTADPRGGDRNDSMLIALRQIIAASGGQCERLTTGIGSCFTSGNPWPWTPDAKYGADRCCNACIAHRALMEGTELRPNIVDGSTSDGYHTFDELYDYRRVYNAALFNEWAARGLYSVHKSWKHSDGEPCFGGDWFIVVATLPTGQISNHYKTDHWRLFRCEARELPDVYDGHTPQIALKRLEEFLWLGRGGIVELADGNQAATQSSGPDRGSAAQDSTSSINSLPSEGKDEQDQDQARSGQSGLRREADQRVDQRGRS